MKLIYKNKKLLGNILLFTFIGMGLGGCSGSSVTFLVDKDPEEAKKQVEKSMTKFGSVGKSEENEGYLHSMQSGFWNPYDVKLFIGTHLGGEGKSAIVRIEGEKEDARILQDVISQDFGLKDQKYIKSYETKNMAIAQTLNLISPGLAHIYNSYGTPRRDALSGTFIGASMMLGDFLLYIFAANAFFFNTADAFSGKAFEKNWPTILIFSGGFRLWTAYDNYLFVRGHNQVVEMGYKFRM